MITSEIIINQMSIDTKDNNALNFNEKELHDTIDNVFKNVGDGKCGKKKTCWYYIKRIIYCGYL